MIQFMPVPDDQRFNFHLKVFENCQPVFGNKTVIMLMFIYVIFNLEDNWNIRWCIKRERPIIKWILFFSQIRKGILGMLERYFQVHSPNGVNFEMQNVKCCIDTLQGLSEVFQLSFPK